MDNPELMGRITKELYPGIAHRSVMSSSKVNGICHAIEVAEPRAHFDALDEGLGKNVCALIRCLPNQASLSRWLRIGLVRGRARKRTLPKRTVLPRCAKKNG